jgi:hypothetical protein
MPQDELIGLALCPGGIDVRFDDRIFLARVRAKLELLFLGHGLSHPVSIRKWSDRATRRTAQANEVEFTVVTEAS